MATQLQFRRGNTAQTAVFTGALAEITVDTGKNTVVVHDGITAGGYPLALQISSQAAFDKANSAYDAANADLSLIAGELASNVEFIAAVNSTQNTNITYVISHANAAYDQANTNAGEITTIQAVNTTQNTNITSVDTKAQAAFNAGNTTTTYAQVGFAHANSAYDAGNTTLTYAQAGYAKANADGVLAQAAFDVGNTTTTYAQVGFAHANAAYDAGNTTLIYSQTGFAHANAAYDSSNAAGILAQAAFSNSNNVLIFAETAYNLANLTSTDVTALYETNLTQNTNIGLVDDKSQAAYDHANTKFSSSGGFISGDVSVTGNLTVTGETFYVNVTNLSVEDNIITLNSNVTGTPSLNAGLEVNRGSETNTSISWNESGKNWQFTNDGTTFQTFASASNTQSAFDHSNTTLTYAEAGYAKANADGVLAQAAFDAGNTTLTYTEAGYAKANADGVLAQAAFDAGNTTLTYSQTGFAHANAAYNKANLSITIGNTATTLGGTNVSVDGLSLVGFNASAGASVGQGQIAWNATDRTFDMGLINGSVLQVGQETLMLVKANNDITNGQAVMFVGVNGNNILGDVCDTSVPGFINDYFIGVATQDMAKNAFGYVTTYGKVRGLNTNGYLAGDILWMDNNTPGALTTTVPAVGTPHIKVAAVTKISGGAGEIMVRPTIKDGLDELYDIGFTGVTTGDILQYNGSIWVNSGNLTSLTTYAQSGFAHSNTTLTYAQAGYAQANSDGVLAQAAFDAGNTTTTYSQTGFAHANSAYDKANASNILAQASFDAANTKFSSDGGTINGNVNVLGDINATGNITYSGSVTSTTITGNTGQFWGYAANGFNALYAGLPAGEIELLPNEVAEFTAANNSYVQINFQNQNGGTSATTDWIATANNGTDTTYFVDLGIAGSGYDNSSPNNSLGTSLFPNDSYLYSQGATSAGQPGGNLVIGAVTSDKYVKVLAGGVNNTNVVATFKPSTVSLSVPLTFSDSTTISSAPATLEYSQSSFAHANSAYDKANSATTLAQAAFDSGNTTLTYAQASYAKANADGVLAQSAYDSGNTASTLSAAINATQNTNISNASSTATDAQVLAQAAYNSGNTTLTYAQSAYAKANTDASDITVLQSVNTTQNTNITTAQTTATNAYTQANAAYAKANTGITGVTITDDNSTATTYYPLFTSSTSGSISSAKVASTNLYFVPQNGFVYAKGTISATSLNTDFNSTGAASYLNTYGLTIANNISTTTSYDIGGTFDVGDTTYLKNTTGLSAGQGWIQQTRYVRWANTTNSTPYCTSVNGGVANTSTVINDSIVPLYNGEVAILTVYVTAQSQGTAGSNLFDGTKTWKMDVSAIKNNNVITLDYMSTAISNTGNSGSWTANVVSSTISGGTISGLSVEVQGESSKNIYWVSTAEKLGNYNLMPAGGGGGGGR